MNVEQGVQRAPADDPGHSQQDGQRPEQDIPMAIDGLVGGQVGKNDRGQDAKHHIDIAYIPFHMFSVFIKVPPVKGRSDDVHQGPG